MRSHLRERLKARVFVRARRHRKTASMGAAPASCVPRGRVLASARPCPSNGWVPASPLGSEDLPEPQERRPARRCAHPSRPHVPHLPIRDASLAPSHMRVCAHCAQASCAADCDADRTAAATLVPAPAASASASGRWRLLARRNVSVLGAAGRVRRGLCTRRCGQVVARPSGLWAPPQSRAVVTESIDGLGGSGRRVTRPEGAGPGIAHHTAVRKMKPLNVLCAVPYES